MIGLTKDRLNKKSSWKFYRGDSGHGTVVFEDGSRTYNLGFSYFLDIKEDLEDYRNHLIKTHFPKEKGILNKIIRFFTPFPKEIHNALIKEKIIQSFSSPSLSATIKDDYLLVLPSLQKPLIEEILDSEHGFVLANGYNGKVYKLFIFESKIKIKRYIMKK